MSSLARNLLIAALAAAAPAGCNCRGSTDASSSAKVVADETSANLALTERIRERLMDDPTMSPAGRSITILVDDGVVLLRGPVATESEGAAIEQLAYEIAGDANTVRNEMRVVQLVPGSGPSLPTPGGATAAAPGGESAGSAVAPANGSAAGSAAPAPTTIVVMPAAPTTAVAPAPPVAPIIVDQNGNVIPGAFMDENGNVVVPDTAAASGSAGAGSAATQPGLVAPGEQPVWTPGTAGVVPGTTAPAPTGITPGTTTPGPSVPQPQPPAVSPTNPGINTPTTRNPPSMGPGTGNAPLTPAPSQPAPRR